ncbi:TPA: lecithin retinol acyltransferase family protein [Vibrio parahaemolyticus]|nr:lecithin retinol acyltransferase family protein [Vibrio parahaemolyticus]
MNPLQYIGRYLLGQLSTSLVDNLFYTTQQPIRGSVVYCDLLFGQIEHSGIYVGDKQIVHRNGKGIIEKVTVNQFLAGTTGISVYVSCDANGHAVGNETTAQIAEAMLGQHSEYSLLDNNCHQFCSYCLSDEWSTSTFTLGQLKQEAKLYLNARQWRVWNLQYRN